MNDPYINAKNDTKRMKIIDNRNIPFMCNNKTYDTFCPLCNILVSYENKTHEKGKKHKIMLTNYLRENQQNFNNECVLTIDSN